MGEMKNKAIATWLIRPEVKKYAELVLDKIEDLVKAEPKSGGPNTVFHYYATVAVGMMAAGAFFLRIAGVRQDEVTEIADWTYYVFEQERVDAVVSEVNKYYDRIDRARAGKDN